MNRILTATAAAAGLLLGSTTATAADMYIDLGTNSYDVTIPLVRTSDGDSTTGIFNEFGFSQILATSIYDMSDGSIFGSFYDTNITSELTAAGVPTSGTALDTVTPVSLTMPDCPNGQCDIDALSPLVPPLGSDNEGFLTTWDLQVEYHFDGILTASGPQYTGGSFNLFFNDFNNDANDRLVISGLLTGSTLNAANLDLFFDITYAEAGWLWIDDGTGSFVDAGTWVNPVTMVLDTNVNPPIPTADQLLLVGTNAIRQSTLDGSVTAELVPEPGTLALFGLGLLGLGAATRRKLS